MQGSFVIQKHQTENGFHFDLMLEQDEHLLTYQMPLPPTELTIGSELAVTRLPNHRKVYLTFEGPISGGRGSVCIVDRGRYEIAEETSESWNLFLAGQAGAAVFCLRNATQPHCYLRRLPPR